MRMLRPYIVMVVFCVVTSSAFASVPLRAPTLGPGSSRQMALAALLNMPVEITMPDVRAVVVPSQFATQTEALPQVLTLPITNSNALPYRR